MSDELEIEREDARRIQDITSNPLEDLDLDSDEEIDDANELFNNFSQNVSRIAEMGSQRNSRESTNDREMKKFSDAILRVFRKNKVNYKNSFEIPIIEAKKLLAQMNEDGGQLDETVWRKCTQLLDCNAKNYGFRTESFKMLLSRIIAETERGSKKKRRNNDHPEEGPVIKKLTRDFDGVYHEGVHTLCSKESDITIGDLECGFEKDPHFIHFTESISHSREQAFINNFSYDMNLHYIMDPKTTSEDTEDELKRTEEGIVWTPQNPSAELSRTQVAPVVEVKIETDQDGSISGTKEIEFLAPDSGNLMNFKDQLDYINRNIVIKVIPKFKDKNMGQRILDFKYENIAVVRDTAAKKFTANYYSSDKKDRTDQKDAILEELDEIIEDDDRYLEEMGRRNDTAGGPRIVLAEASGFLGDGMSQGVVPRFEDLGGDMGDFEGFDDANQIQIFEEIDQGRLEEKEQAEEAARQERGVDFYNYVEEKIKKIDSEKQNFGLRRLKVDAFQGYDDLVDPYLWKLKKRKRLMRRKKTSKTITITTVGVDDNQSVMTAPNDGAAASVKSAEDDRELEIDFNEIDDFDFTKYERKTKSNTINALAKKTCLVNSTILDLDLIFLKARNHQMIGSDPFNELFCRQINDGSIGNYQNIDQQPEEPTSPQPMDMGYGDENMDPGLGYNNFDDFNASQFPGGDHLERTMTRGELFEQKFSQMKFQPTGTKGFNKTRDYNMHELKDYIKGRFLDDILESGQKQAQNEVDGFQDDIDRKTTAVDGNREVRFSDIYKITRRYFTSNQMTLKSQTCFLTVLHLINELGLESRQEGNDFIVKVSSR